MKGGAVYNNGTIHNINGNFIGNYVSDPNRGIYGAGGAIYNGGNIDSITGYFIGNHSVDSGGAILNNGVIGNVTANFIGNYSNHVGGAIENYSSQIGDITGDFIGNYSDTAGGAIYNCAYVRMGNITGDFIGNYSQSGGAILNGADAHIKNITGDFLGNHALRTGGAIDNSSGIIGNITGNFIKNYAFEPAWDAYVAGGAIYNLNFIGDITGDFIENHASVSNGQALGGAIYNEKFIGTRDSSNNLIGGIINSNFINNYAESPYKALGGAIYTNSKQFNIIADNAVSRFSGNYVQITGGEKVSNAIYVGAKHVEDWDLQKDYYTVGSVNLIARNNGKIIINDKISGVSHHPEDYDSSSDSGVRLNYSLHFTGDSTGTIILNNTVEAESFNPDLPGSANITLSNTNLHLATRDNVLDHNNLTLNSGHLNMINNQTGLSSLNSFTLTGDTNLSVDVDLSSKTMDRLTSPTYGTHTGTLNVSNMHLTSDAGRDFTAIYFAEPGLKNNVSTTVKEVAYTPIYKYTVSYDNQNQYDDLGDGGYFLFTRGTGSTNPSDSFNPAVLTTPVSNVAASQSTVNETFKYVFEHADAFSQMPLMERMSYLNNNKYALSTTYNENLGRITYSQNNAGWLRPYTTFESINLKNGPKVDAITYGSLAGFDGNFKEMHHGWYRIGTGYLGYNGSQLNYHHNDTTMNGGLLGFTETFYKKNFWTALTLSAGASVGETRTMYGKEDFTTLLAGVGSKTGYNLEFQEGKYILQPIMFLSYTFVNTFDYTNASGTRISTTPAHSIQLNPSFRFITNCKNGWQPYASVGMVWNLMNSSDIRANGIKLPEMRMKPYVEYGLGLQRNWKERFTAFGQAMVRNGGRNGVALTFGFRWAIGKGGEDL